jgi:excinuclease ABC subunit A
MAEGSPEQVAAHPESYTGEFLKNLVKAAEPKPARKRKAAVG